MRHCFLFFLLISFTLTGISQNIYMFRTAYYPSNPSGGERELKSFFKQELVYPTKAKEEEIEGEVFITYKISANGKIAYKKVEDSGDELLQKEAERIFDKIIWEIDLNRKEEDIGMEKLKLSFNLKKYNKLVKKRGYDQLPKPYEEVDNSNEIFNINQLEERPKFDGEQSINQFVSANFKYPNVAIQQGIEGKVVVEYIIEPYGLASNIRVKEAVGGGCNEETIRLVKKMRWIPAIKDGKAVRCRDSYQLNFRIPNGGVR